MTESQVAADIPRGTSRFILFMDECGDHSMEKIDADFPLFVLSAVVVERTDYIAKIIPSIGRLKLRYWDEEGVNLHSREIRKATGRFSMLQNPLIRATFLEQIQQLMADLPFFLFITAIHKGHHRDRYGKLATNPYELALTFTFERALQFLEAQGETALPVIAEKRGQNEDQQLQAAFFNLLRMGTEYLSADRFAKVGWSLQFEDKVRNICGIQLADLCAYPAARQILKPDQPNRAFKVVNQHIYSGNPGGWKIFP